MKSEAMDQLSSLDMGAINTIRTLSMDAIQKANSGHPGAPMGLATVGHVLFNRILKHHPKNPNWLDRDRFVLSGGHASMLLYSLLYLTGYDISLDDIKNFRQMGSKTPGHPEYGITPGVETSTGPLGQGFANGVGMAMAERSLAARFNRPGHTLVDHYTYVMCGDGDLMEGISAEAASLAGHLGLSKLICLYDDNKISIEGSTDITFTENVEQRFLAYGWNVLRVTNASEDPGAVEGAIREAKSGSEKPSLIILSTHIAYGSPNKQGSAEAHGAPLGEEEVCLTKECLGLSSNEIFCVPEKVLEFTRRCVERGRAEEERWKRTADGYWKKFPELFGQFEMAVNGILPENCMAALPRFNPSDGSVATRSASGTVLNAIAPYIPFLMGGSADLAPSNKTYLSGMGDFQKGNFGGRNIRFGVREHAMAAISSGMILHGGVKAYCGTFLVFSDYMRPSIRMAALMEIPLIFVFTHDSVAVGEDGPTHQPVEHIAALRLIPGLTVIRPADGNETAGAWEFALSEKKGPVAIILSRQKLPNLDPMKAREGVRKGAYILEDAAGNPDIIIVATGSEVGLALNARKLLKEKGIDARVVSMPSWELFEKMPESYRREVLLEDTMKRLVIEAGSPMGWERYAKDSGGIIGIRTFGTSAPGGKVMEKFGFTPEHAASLALEIVGKKN